MNPLSQSGHLKGLSFVWERMWISSPDAQPNTLKHKLVLQLLFYMNIHVESSVKIVDLEIKITLKQILQVVLPLPMRKLAGAENTTLIILCLSCVNSLQTNFMKFRTKH